MAIRVRFSAEHTNNYELVRDGALVARQGQDAPVKGWLPAQAGDVLVSRQGECCFSLRASDVVRGYVFTKDCSRAKGWNGTLVLLRPGKHYYAGSVYDEGGVTL